MSKWRIYYSDGTTFDYREDSQKMPAYGVVCILQQRGHDGRFFITSGTPYYMYVKDEWLPAWLNDVEDYLANRLDKIDKFVVGRIVPKADFVTIFERAKKDREHEILD